METNYDKVAERTQKKQAEQSESEAAQTQRSEITGNRSNPAPDIAKNRWTARIPYSERPKTEVIETEEFDYYQWLTDRVTDLGSSLSENLKQARYLFSSLERLSNPDDPYYYKNDPELKKDLLHLYREAKALWAFVEKTLDQPRPNKNKEVIPLPDRDIVFSKLLSSTFLKKTRLYLLLYISRQGGLEKGFNKTDKELAVIFNKNKATIKDAISYLTEQGFIKHYEHYDLPNERWLFIAPKYKQYFWDTYRAYWMEEYRIFYED